MLRIKAGRIKPETGDRKEQTGNLKNEIDDH